MNKYQNEFNYDIVTYGIPGGKYDVMHYFNREGLVPPEVEIDLDNETATYVYTSGSTGLPKGIAHSYTGFNKVALAVNKHLEISNKDVIVTSLPVNQMFGAIAAMMLPLLSGATAVLLEFFNPETCLELMEDMKATVFIGVPTLYIRMINQYKNSLGYNLSTMRTGVVAGALSSPDLISEIKNVLGFDVQIAYGMTEFVFISMTKLTDSLEIRSTSVGSFIEGVEYRIIDDDGNDVAPGADGELLIRGPWAMQHYAGEAVQTSEGKDADGWVHSGDIVRQDENNVLYIRGRKKDLIIRGGRNIYPGEVEKVFSRHENVNEVCVMGAPHKEMGEQTIAFIVLHDASADNYDSLKLYVKTQAAGYMVPDKIFFMDAIPKLVNGKYDKVGLKNFLIEQGIQ